MKSNLAQLLHSVKSGVVAENAFFEGITTDSRSAASGNLFVALRGDRFDAHDFLSDVIAKGVAAVVVEHVPVGVKVPALVVPNTRVALGEIAMGWRRQFTLPVIGVTGSNGKTTVKEMIASILNAAFGENHFMATRGNFNNDIGVPLTMLRLTSSHQAAVIELGMNHPGEIAVLSAIAQPTVALVNNAQREHQEFMESVEAVARENGAVIQSLAEDGIAVFPSDDPHTPLWREYASKRKVISFGFSDDADVSCTVESSDFGSLLQVNVGENKFPVTLAAAGLHNVRNAMAAIACASAMGISVAAITRGLESFAPVNGRLQRKLAPLGTVVIDDTYNANPDSVRAAIDVLAQANAPRILVLGDMGEVGDDGVKFHEEIGAYAAERGIDVVHTLGVLAQHSTKAFGMQGQHHETITALNQKLSEVITAASTVLVKGSRFMKMERVVQHLLGGELGDDNKKSLMEAH